MHAPVEHYSIKEIENLSGIKAHTLRIWEKRYDITSPNRTATNIRWYSADDLKKILSISILNKNGFKISKIAKLNSNELTEIIHELNTTSKDSELYIDQLVMGLVKLDEAHFVSVLSSISIKIGFEKMITEVLYPFLDRIGILWITEKINPAQEHFISNLIRQKLIVAIDSLPIGQKSPSFLLYLRENELHEIGILFLTYLIRRKGFKLFYLGQSVPLDDLIDTCKVHQPDYLVTSIIAPSTKTSIVNHFNELNKRYPSKIILNGAQIGDIPKEDLPSSCHFFETAKSFEHYLDQY
jgi:DNA-binding transcriptional MerR regulator/methylmalonyl-CoA mutase cobalamin-binding subunit